MSNFNVLNPDHVIALAIIEAEVVKFNDVSDRAVANANALGLVPDDLDILRNELNSIGQMVEMAQDPRFGNDPAFMEALAFGQKVAMGIVAATHFVDVAFEQGVVFKTEDGTPTWSEDFNANTAGYADLKAEVSRRVLNDINANNNKNEDNEEVELEGGQQGSEQAGSVGEEQEEGDDSGRDVSVSAPVAA